MALKQQALMRGAVTQAGKGLPSCSTASGKCISGVNPSRHSGRIDRLYDRDKRRATASVHVCYGIINLLIIGNSRLNNSGFF